MSIANLFVPNDYTLYCKACIQSNPVPQNYQKFLSSIQYFNINGNYNIIYPLSNYVAIQFLTAPGPATTNQALTIIDSSILQISNQGFLLNNFYLSYSNPNFANINSIVIELSITSYADNSPITQVDIPISYSLNLAPNSGSNQYYELVTVTTPTYILSNQSLNLSISFTSDFGIDPIFNGVMINYLQ